MTPVVRTSVVAVGAIWALAACVGQLQFDPTQSGPGGGQAQHNGTGGSVGAVGTGGGVGSTGGTQSGAGGGASADDAGVQQAACPAGFDVVTAVFKDKCGGCHGATAPTKGLDLVTAGVGARTVDVVSTCNKKPLVSSTLVAGAPSGHLLDKLAGPVTGCGVQMPAGGTPLTATEMACVKEWALKAIDTATAGGGSY